METTSTLTATEVIDACPRSPRGRACRRGTSAPAGRAVGAAAPLRRRTPIPPAGAGPPSTTTASSRWPDPAPRWSTEFAPASLGAALGITLDAAKQLIADALELTYRLPRLWTLVVAGLVPVWLARTISRETHDLSVEAVAYADRLISATPDKIRQVNATRLVDEARLYFDPDRAVEDEVTNSPSAASGPDPGGSTRHHRRVHDPGHPRRRALRPDHRPHRRRARCPRRHRQPRHPQSKGGRDPRRPPIRPGPALRPRRRRPHHQTAGDDEPLRPPHPGRPGRHRRGGDREARRRHHRPPDRLAGPPLRRRRQGQRPTRPRPHRSTDRGRPARPTRARCANRSSCATATASSPAADATPGPATSTTSPPTSPWTRAAHPARPTHSTLAPLCRTHHRIKTFTAWDYKRLDHDGTLLRLDRTHRTPVRGRTRPPAAHPPRRT